LEREERRKFFKNGGSISNILKELKTELRSLIGVGKV
jgi:hypothetical protein